MVTTLKTEDEEMGQAASNRSPEAEQNICGPMAKVGKMHVSESPGAAYTHVLAKAGIA